MRVIGVDPSLTNLGYVVLDSEKGLLDKGKFQTGTEDGLNIQRYFLQAQRMSDLIRKYEIKHIASESPIMRDFSTEILFGLQSILQGVYWAHGLKVVYLAPTQVKSYACPNVKGKVFKSDMVKAARIDLGMAETARLANDVADAYWIGKIGLRFWSFMNQELKESDLTKKERTMFLHTHEFTRGKKKGLTERKGIVFRRNEIYYLFDEIPFPETDFLRRNV